MEKVAVFGLLSLVIVYLSRRTIINIHSHGFYRFLSWEFIAWLFASNFRFWFVNPLGTYQLGSWIFLCFSVYLVTAGITQLKGKGNQKPDRAEKNLYGFEKTSTLVDSGIYKYIRHPMYSSLIFLTWGIFLKNATIELFIAAAASTTCLYITSLYDEKECMNYFGNSYHDYMKTSRRFIPFLF